MRKLLALVVFLPMLLSAQAVAVLRGKVVDPSDSPVPGARVLLANALTGYERVAEASAEGAFEFTNVPFNGYRLRVTVPGFDEVSQDVSLRTSVPVSTTIRLAIASGRTVVTVGGEPPPLVEPEETGTHVQLSLTAMSHFAGTNGPGLESVLVTLPGFAKNANGAIHPRGAHNQTTYVVDGMAIADQLTGAFANSLDPNVAQTVELFTGNIPAEFGGKTAAVVNVITKSGIGSGRRMQGNTMLQGGSFDALSQVTQVSGEFGRLGYSAALNTSKSHRYLDQVGLQNFHNGGNSERAFVRVDYQPNTKDIFRWTSMAGRSSFELANLRSQRAAGQDQRQLLRDASLSFGWVRALDPKSTVETTVSYRTAAASLIPSAGDTPVTARQDRRLSTLAGSGRYSRLMGRHTLRAGLDYQGYPVRERFAFGITAADFNVPGEDGYNPNLLRHDLSRGGSLFRFDETGYGSMSSGFVQDSVKWKRLTLALGLRFDVYRFLVRASQLQPRLGVAWQLGRSTSVRASYNRTFQTPPNENLLLSASEKAAALAPPEVGATFGGRVAPIVPERQNVVEVGLQQGLGRFVGLSASFYRKTGRDQQDNNNFLNTGVIFPITLQKIRVKGAEARVTLLPVRGISGSLSATRSRAISTPPFTGGLFLGNDAIALLSAGPFVIDHDQALSLHGNLQYSHRSGVWISGSVRYDSGLVSNPSDPAVVAADPDYADLLPLVNLESSPARVRPRTISDLAIGYGGGDGQRWEVIGEVSNVTDRPGLYNFQSVFVGTRLIAPRAFSLRLRLKW